MGELTARSQQICKTSRYAKTTYCGYDPMPIGMVLPLQGSAGKRFRCGAVGRTDGMGTGPGREGKQREWGCG